MILGSAIKGRTFAGLMLAAAMPAAAWAGDLKGKTTFSEKGGEPEKRSVIKMDADPTCAGLHTDKVGTENVIVNKDKTIRNVIIYVKSGLKSAAPPPSSQAVTLDQNGCIYKPHVLTLQTDQTLTVKNSDETLHNIHGLPEKNPEFNFGQPKAGMTKDLTFKKPEIFRVKCDVHPWMGAVIGVFDHSFHAVSDNDGNYQIKGLAAGEYEIAAWHEVYGEFTQKVTIKEGEPTELNFEISKQK